MGVKYRFFAFKANGEYIGEIERSSIKSAVVKSSVSSMIDTFEITTSFVLDKYMRVVYTDCSPEGYNDNGVFCYAYNEFIVTGYTKTHDADNNLYKDYYLEQSTADLRFNYILDKRLAPDKQTLANAMKNALDGSLFTFVESALPGSNVVPIDTEYWYSSPTLGVGNKGVAPSVNYYHQSSYQCILDAAKLFKFNIGDIRRPYYSQKQPWEKGFMSSLNRVLRFDNSFDVKQELWFGRDFNEITEKLDENDAYTAYYVWGKGVESGDGYSRRIGMKGRQYREITLANAKTSYGILGSNRFGELVSDKIVQPTYLESWFHLTAGRSNPSEKKYKLKTMQNGDIRCSIGDVFAVYDRDFFGEKLSKRLNVTAYEEDLMAGRQTYVDMEG